MVKVIVNVYSNADPGNIWSMLGNVQRLQQYLRIGGDVRIIDSVGTYVRVAFKLRLPTPFNRAEALIRLSSIDKTMSLSFLRGPFKGRHVLRVIELGNSPIRALVTGLWDVKLSFPLNILYRSWVTKYLMKWISEELQSIVGHVDGYRLGTLGNSPIPQPTPHASSI